MYNKRGAKQTAIMKAAQPKGSGSMIMAWQAANLIGREIAKRMAA